MFTQRLIPAFALLALTPMVQADVKLPALFSNHMVLQGGVALPVWGWADPGEEITVEVAGQKRTTKAGEDGKWKVVFGALKPAEGLVFKAKGKNELTATDVLVGDVWLCSGQSNMEMTVNSSSDVDSEKAAAKFPKIRMFTVPYGSAAEPKAECGGEWQVCSPETVGNFSAAGYAFGRELHQKLGINVGLINSSVGGTKVEAWTSMDAMADKPEFKGIFEEWKKSIEEYEAPENIKKYESEMTWWKDASAKAVAAGEKKPQEPRRAGRARLDNNHPGNLFNAKINPLIPYPIKGAVWYQGESNANDGKFYAYQLPLMIKDWRARWGNEFPFAWVQLVNFEPRNPDPGAPSAWALVREAMVKALATPNTGMTVNIDIGDEKDIHPKNKREIGRRLSLWALARVYGKAIPYSGPLYTKMSKGKKGDVTLSFQHTDGGLVAKGKEGALTGFAIAGADQKWVWATAKLSGNTVVVSSPEVKDPVAVRYAWGQNPECNLFNGVGLPASPFRTDEW